MQQLLEVHETLTPADNQTHRRYPFQVPANCYQLELWVRYSPKLVSEQQSRALAGAALRQQTAALATLLGQPLAEQWSAKLTSQVGAVRIGNLLTVSLDDASHAYRGSGHRQANDQRLIVGAEAASPGLVAGPLPVGYWVLTLSAHTLVSAQCDVSIQIGAEMASSA